MGWSYSSSITIPCSQDELFSVFLKTKKYVEEIEEFSFFGEYKNGHFVGNRVRICAERHKGSFSSVGFRDLLSGLCQLFPERAIYVTEICDQSFVTHLLIGEQEVVKIYEDDMGSGEIMFEEKEKYDFCTYLDETGEERWDMSIFDHNTHLEIVHSDNDLIGIIKDSFLEDPDVEKMKEILLQQKR